MSRHQFRGSIARTLAELEIDPSCLWGSGSTDYPYLHWQMELHLLPEEDPMRDYAFRSMAAQLYCLPGQKIADARPVTLHRVLRGHDDYHGSEHPVFEFPLDAQRIAALEECRKGGSLKLRLDMQLTVEQHGIIDAHPESNRPALYGLFGVHQLMLQQEFQISQSDWIEHVLSRVGFGQVHVIELPGAPLEQCERLSHAFKALSQAQEKHRLGFYDDAVGKCRVALEKFFDAVPVDPKTLDSRRIPVLKKSWETKLGKATYDWLNSTLGAVKGASNSAHHSPDRHYSQFDSQMLIVITTALVAYVARSTDMEES